MKSKRAKSSEKNHANQSANGSMINKPQRATNPPRRRRRLTLPLGSIGPGVGDKGCQQTRGLAHTCAGCNKPIKRDRYLLKACEKYWHENCLRCDKCHSRLGELGSTLYCKFDMNLCRQDYLEMFGETGVCSVCEKLICSSEMVMRAKNNVYHLECFACQLCNQRFCVGDRFYLCENRVVCQYDYEEHIVPIQQSFMDQQGGTEIYHRQEMTGGLDICMPASCVDTPGDGPTQPETDQVQYEQLDSYTVGEDAMRKLNEQASPARDPCEEPMDAGQQLHAAGQPEGAQAEGTAIA